MRAPDSGPAAGPSPDPGQTTLSQDLQILATHRLVEALVASEQRMRQRVDVLSEIVFELDARSQIVFLSRAWARLTGIAQEVAMARPLSAFVAPGDREAFDRLLAQADLAPGHERPLVHLIRADGSTLAMELTVVATREGGRIGALHDVTDERRIREQLEEARRRAEDANEAKSRFLSAMSHEIRTPMNGVLGLAALMLDGPLDPTQRQYASMIASSGQSLLAIIDDILDFSKVEAGKLTVEDIDFDLDALLEDLVGLHRHRAAARGLALEARTGPGVPRHVRGDPHRLRQVLNNLLGNACKFTEAGSVRLGITAESAGEGRTSLRFEVADTGIGIPADTLPRLFQPFSQADSSNSRRFGGTGLGLAITRQLVELMQGRIALTSTEGVGTTVTVQLPFAVVAAPPEPSDDVPDGPREAPRRAARLLLAEDNRTNQVVACGLLAKLGCHDVVVVDDGAQALEAVQREPFDLVLMDCQMPVLDGYRATTQLRELGYRMPVIALTANAMRGDRDASLAAGMDDHVSKPVQLRDLAAALDRWLPAAPPGPRAASPATQAPASAAAMPAFDRRDLLDRVGGDESLLDEILAVAVADLPVAIGRIEQAVAAADREALRLHAHGLKGAAANVGAVALAEAARHVEAEARAGRFAVTAPLRRELDRFRTALGRA